MHSRNEITPLLKSFGAFSFSSLCQHQLREEDVSYHALILFGLAIHTFLPIVTAFADTPAGVRGEKCPEV